MAMSTSPSTRSPWSPVPHGVDYNGYAAHSPSSPLADTSMQSKASRQRRGSSPGKRALNWFTRSRSVSPAAGADGGDQDKSEPPSPSSFVVRRVIKQPGGVSHGYEAEGASDLPLTYCGQEPYRKVKSRPISLGVPPGGPGGGTGYGTVHSSNDGRPEPERTESATHDRGRSRSTSPGRPASPGAINAGAFRGNGTRLSPSQLSSRQEQREGQSRQQSIAVAQPSGPRSSPSYAGSPMVTTGSAPSPHQISARTISPAIPTVSAVSAHANQHPSRYSIHNLPPGSVLPPVIPLEGVPSPVKIPLSPRQAGVSPLGSASPGSGMFGTSNDDRSGGSPSVASRWFKGLFNKSPQEDRDDRLCTSSEAQWVRSGAYASPNHANGMQQQNANAWTDGSPLAGVRPRDEVEADALARKKHSMAMAARIEDEHRSRLMNAEARQQAQQAWMPRQVLNEAPLTQEPEHEFPQSRSPPGRKPPPRFTAQDLKAMSQQEREQVASEVDPDDRLSRLEGRLTPAQQIIAETRSRMMKREMDETSTRSDSGTTHLPPTQVQRGFDTNRRLSSGGAAPVVPSKASHEMRNAKQEERVSTVARREQQSAKPAVSQVQDATQRSMDQSTASPNGGKGLSAGSGPMPNSMPLASALQEMMVRFYRFERYAVPLMRSLEGRLVDVERDNQMALNGDGMSANSTRDREMDRWVGQMTGLMQHEIGQLRAATREIREAREVLAGLAKQQTSGDNAAVSSSIRMKEDDSRTSDSDILSALPTNKILQKGTDADARRESNFSSSSFKSAIRKTDTPEPQHSSNVTTNASPNGRPRYTQALGRPLQDGKISPMVSPATEHAPPLLPPSRSASEQCNASRRIISIDDRLKALVNDRVRSPSMTASSIKSGVSMHSQAGQVGGARESSIGNSSQSSATKVEYAAPEKIGDDYELNTGVDCIETTAQHCKTTSSFSTQTATTVKPTTTQAQYLAPASVAVPSRALSMPSTPLTASSPQTLPSPLTPNMTGNSLKLATAISTPTRPQSSSPINLMPSTPSSITAAPHVSQGLRARAQSYLQSADGTSASATPPVLSNSNSKDSNVSGSPALAPVNSSRSILRSRTLNEVSNTLASEPSHTIRPISSADQVIKSKQPKSATMDVRPLSINKTTSPTKSSPAKSVLQSHGKVVAKESATNSIPFSTTTSAATTPSRPSIKDRVAFFDAAQRST